MKNLILIIIAVAVVARLTVFNNSLGSPPAFVESYGDSVVLYVTSWCGYCKSTKKILDSKGIDYIEYDVENSSRGAREFKQLGGRGVPLALVHGEVIKGYAPEKIVELVTAPAI